jgi:hypothetical protein
VLTQCLQDQKIIEQLIRLILFALIDKIFSSARSILLQKSQLQEVPELLEVGYKFYVQ